jgi:UTP-glucose-1-phosphate uridylyltransferase
MKTLILIGGKGTRMSPMTDYCPKEMFPMISKPFLQVLVEKLKSNKIEDNEIIFILSKEKISIIQYFKNLGYNFDYVIDEGKGLGNAIISAKHKLNNEPFLLMLGDMLLLGNYNLIGRMLDLHYMNKANVLGSFHSHEDENKYCSIKTNGNICLHLIEKPKMHVSNYSTSGQYIFNYNFIELLEKQIGFKDGYGFTNAMNELIKNNLVLHCYDIDGIMLDVGTPDAYAKSVFAYYNWETSK